MYDEILYDFISLIINIVYFPEDFLEVEKVS